MKHRRLLPYPTYGLLALTLVTASVSKAAVNIKPIANAGADQVVAFSFPVGLNGTQSKDLDGSIKKYQWRQIGGPTMVLNNTSIAKPLFFTPAKVKNQKPLRLIFKLTVTDNKNTIATANTVINVVTEKLNDTGIVTCADGISNDLSCPVTGYPGQDAEIGRDSHSNNADGAAGFNFSKIDGSGNITSADNWDCVKDNVTGLLWQTLPILGNDFYTYSWYEPNISNNGGAAGTQNTGQCNDANAKPPTTHICDTNGYVKAVNANGMCGAKDWRLPTKKELYSVLYYNNYTEAALDPKFFGYGYNHSQQPYWTASAFAGNKDQAWAANLNEGSFVTTNKNSALHIMLVSGRQ